MPDSPLIKLQNLSTIKSAEIPADDISRAVTKQLKDVERGWGIDTARILRDLNRQGFRVVLRDHSSDPQAVAEHYRLTGKPTATVYIRDILEDKNEKGDWKTGKNSVSAAVSHEVVELFVDPLSMYYVDGLDGYIYALEIADPTQDDVYPIGRVAVSNFTYRSYWNPWAKPSARLRLDHRGLMKRPFEVRKGGYVVRYKASNTAHTIDGRAFPIRKRLVKASKPNGRTRRRLEQLAKLSDGGVELPPLGGTSATRVRKR